MSKIKTFNEYNIFNDPDRQPQPLDLRLLFADGQHKNLVKDFSCEYDDQAGIYRFSGTTYSPMSGYQGGKDQYAEFEGTATNKYPTIIHVTGAEYYGYRKQRNIDETFQSENISRIERFLLELAE
jgi:hypothetical protein